MTSVFTITVFFTPYNNSLSMVTGLCELITHRLVLKIIHIDVY